MEKIRLSVAAKSTDFYVKCKAKEVSCLPDNSIIVYYSSRGHSCNYSLQIFRMHSFKFIEILLLKIYSCLLLHYLLASTYIRTILPRFGDLRIGFTNLNTVNILEISAFRKLSLWSIYFIMNTRGFLTDPQ